VKIAQKQKQHFIMILFTSFKLEQISKQKVYDEELSFAFDVSLAYHCHNHEFSMSRFGFYLFKTLTTEVSLAYEFFSLSLL
jgi:uncharacterized membrane protein